MTDFQLPPTHNPCPWCETAPCPHCRDARRDGPGLLDWTAIYPPGTKDILGGDMSGQNAGGTICPQGYAILLQRLKGNTARRFVDREEFRTPDRFCNAKMTDLSHPDAKYPQRAWQTACAGHLNEWIRATIYQEPERMLNVAIKGRSSGVGKTYVAAAVVNQLRDSGISAVLVEIRNLLGMIYAARFRDDAASGGRMTVEEIFDVVKKCEVLVLDDIKVIAVTDYQRETLWEIVNGRYQNLKSTIITTQIDGQKLSPDSEWFRILRRIADKSACLTIDIDKENDPRPAQARRDIEG